MANFFETEFGLFDPSSRFESDYLSFASLSSALSPPPLDPHGYDPSDGAAGFLSDSSSPAPSDSFDSYPGLFDPATPPSGDVVGIFHTPPKSAGYESSSFLQAQGSPESSYNTFSKIDMPSSSSSSFPLSIPTDEIFLSSPPTGSYSWDEAAPVAASSSFQAPLPSSKPLRVASNPTLGPSRNTRHVKHVTSMPELQEQGQGSHEWLNPSQYSADPQGFQQFPTGPSSKESLVENFDSVFGDYGLNKNNSGTTGFEFQSPTDQSYSCDIPTYYTALPHNGETQWGFGPSTNMPAHVGLFPAFELPQQVIHAAAPAEQNTLTINPTAVMKGDAEDDASRPWTAPGKSGEKVATLSAPMSEPMAKRSLSSSGYKTSKYTAPVRDLFSYAPHQHSSGDRPLYTCDPSPTYYRSASSQHRRAMPSTPTPQPRAARVISDMFSAPQEGQFSRYPTAYPPTPNSPAFSMMSAVPPLFPAPVTMQRAETTPIPAAHQTSRSVTLNPSLLSGKSTRAHDDDDDDVERMRPRKRSRRVSMTEPRVMQHTLRRTTRQNHPRPLFASHPQIHPPPMGSSALPTAPLVTVHPPPQVHPPPIEYGSGGAPSTPRRVHPPPHPGSAGRPIARLPSPRRQSPIVEPPTPLMTAPTPRGKRRATPPKKRTPSSSSSASGVGDQQFRFGNAMFVNFTSEDADLLLAGVAPSGAMAKKKRDREAALLEQEQERYRVKRSRS
ncbi:hypothetical protein L198_06075 [Cryptococcus wingfieldii CBS 7118]|uniref:Uncharacterized protein n=1 Tax=Cryptococcus wingfieldii CBS 7118 TaxID=1295528 RepID=A0A1E3IQ85_9TREE|nr:hypothetical protein L198_06075 [Cryptococcus wingfieldii CBS 7118]ODN90759.1 hypothetical protein L198_06075 [Cryptococcus wingfieldii CBS 7118]